MCSLMPSLGCYMTGIDIKMKLANSTESELRLLQSSLQGQKDGVAVDLQRNVFKKFVA